MLRLLGKTLPRPTATYAILWSLGTHTCAFLTIVALDAWGVDVNEAMFSGSTHVAQIELNLSASGAEQPARKVTIDSNEGSLPEAAVIKPAATFSAVPADKLPVTDMAAAGSRIPRRDLAHEWYDAMRGALPAFPDAGLPAPDPSAPARRDSGPLRPERPEPFAVRVAGIPRRTAEVQLPAPAAPARQRVGTDEKTAPSFAGNRPPAYPATAWRRGLEGEVLLRIFVSAAGRVERVEIVRSSGHPSLDASAVQTVRTWRGQPARRRDRPVATVELLPVRFRLRR